ncbi:MAG: peptidylprolyl isomerase [Bauldia sp.]|nr:MAG: peptidylprolyl isomerase [Bauldia sp.]
MQRLDRASSELPAPAPSLKRDESRQADQTIATLGGFKAFWTPSSETDKRGAHGCQRRHRAGKAAPRPVFPTRHEPTLAAELDNSMTAGFGLHRSLSFRLAAIVATVFVCLLRPAAAQEESAVVAIVNGEPITEADLALAAAEFGDQLSQIAPASRRAALVDLIVNIRLAGKAAEADGLDKDAAVASRLELARERTLYSEYLRKQFVAAVTEDAARKIFDAELAKFVPADQVHASHILVKTEDEAKAIVAELDKGADFAAIAKEKSLDPGSGAKGGDLGFFGRGAMVKPFEDAAFGLEVGSYTKIPVESDFGWHVITVVETRKEPPPTFESEAQRIQQDLIRATFEKAIEGLRSAATIEMVTPSPQPPAAPPPADTPPAQ